MNDIGYETHEVEISEHAARYAQQEILIFVTDSPEPNATQYTSADTYLQKGSWIRQFCHERFL